MALGLLLQLVGLVSSSFATFSAAPFTLSAPARGPLFVALASEELLDGRAMVLPSVTLAPTLMLAPIGELPDPVGAQLLT
eukprot:753345-Lingulodinium_polyedra.AAC.1